VFFPLVFTIMAGSLSTISATGSWSCGLDKVDVLWGCTMGLLICNFVAASPLLFASVVKFVQIIRETDKVPIDALRLVILGVFFFVYFFYTIVAQGIIYKQEAPVTAAATAWLTCLLENNGAVSKCGSQPSEIISPDLIFPFIFGSVTGLSIGLIFTDFESFRLWKYFLSTPNRFSFSKMAELTVCSKLQQTMTSSCDNRPNAHSDSSQPIELAKVDTRLLHETKTDTVLPEDTENTSSHTGQNSERVLFNPFILDSVPLKRGSSSKQSPESPTSESIDVSLSGIESPSINPVTFQLPAVSEQPGESNESLSDSQTGTSLVKSTSATDLSP